MGTVMPSDKREMVMFGNTHVAPWTANKVVLGIGDPDLAAFTLAASNAQKAFDAAEAARQASKAATTAFYASVSTLREKAGTCVRIIQNKAKSTNDPNLYAIGQISPPEPRSQQGPPPAQPSDIRAGLNSDGSITLTWKCANPPGVSNVIYFVQRKLNGQTDFTLFDTVGEKTLIDATIPRSAGGASYMITARHGQQSGQTSETFSVVFGVGGGGSIVMTTSADGTGMKMAA